VDIIGLSGLITPSLDEMVHIAKEMQRQGFTIPIMLGGATTSRAHTAVKIAPEYTHPVIWVKDASRAVGVAQNLISEGMREDFVAGVHEDYVQLRRRHAGRQQSIKWLSLDEARANRAAIDWDAYTPPPPAATGVQVFDTIDLARVSTYIDWTPFFHAWELKGAYPRILSDKEKGKEANRLFSDAKAMLESIIREKWLTARAVIGLFPAAATPEDDVLVYSEASRQEVAATLHFLRQQQVKPPGRPNRCLADFIAPIDSGLADHIGMFAVTAGIGIEERIAAFEAAHDDYSAIMLKVLADRLAEALAEMMHADVRRCHWGYAPGETLDNEALIHEAYQGIRPAPGYPACPEHTEKATIWQLLDADQVTGITLTESYAMHPGASVSGYYIAHPEACYFAVGKINHDQVADYARRKGMDMAEAERWLAPNLGYSTG